MTVQEARGRGSTPGSPPAGRELQELRLLFALGQTLDRSLDLRDAVSPVLQAMAEHMGMLRGTLTLVDRASGEIYIEAAWGLSLSQQKRGRYALGEGVTGKVVQTGQPAVVPRISQAPLFLNRTGARRRLRKRDISFICVPIRVGSETVGALSADRLFAGNVSLDEDVRLLSIIASMIAQAVRLRQAAQEERRFLLEENARLQQELKDRFRPANIVGTSRAMQAVYDMIGRVCKSDTTVLIRGESGTGKELVARSIHYNSPRAGKSFIRVNCVALPETLLDSELFGHERGAFTGAVARRQGRFELAHGGTIFLDEIGDIPAATQGRLLRVLQEREFERVGGSETVHTDVRVLAATNRNLEELVADGRFREDLYYRLNVFPIHVPPLRERRSDILLLADFFVEKYARANSKTVHRISAPALDLLVNCRWRGNVRELENCVERAVLLTDEDVIRAHHLPPTVQNAESAPPERVRTLQATLDDVEREMLLDALRVHRGNMSRAAKALGLTDRMMGLRVRKHAIRPREFRTSE